MSAVAIRILSQKVDAASWVCKAHPSWSAAGRFDVVSGNLDTDHQPGFAAPGDEREKAGARQRHLTAGPLEP
jgi:hypothetical protein